MKFNEYKLDPRLLKAIANRGYKTMTDVQEKTLAVSLKGRDVTVQSQTGTGKTAVFLITLMEHMLHSKRSERKPALIIVPTRELAVQVELEPRTGFFDRSFIRRRGRRPAHRQAAQGAGYHHRHPRKADGSERQRPLETE